MNCNSIKDYFSMNNNIIYPNIVIIKFQVKKIKQIK